MKRHFESTKMIKVPKELWEDTEWGEKHYSELVKKYPDQWIAIVNKKVVSAGKSLRNVEIEAERKTSRKRDQIPVMFVEGSPSIL